MSILIFVGIGLGLVMSLFSTMETFIASFSILITAIVLSFLIYIIPKFIGSLKKVPEQLPPSFYLAKGVNGESPKVKKSAKINLITIDL